MWLSSSRASMWCNRGGRFESKRLAAGSCSKLLRARGRRRSILPSRGLAAEHGSTSEACSSRGSIKSRRLAAGNRSKLRAGSSNRGGSLANTSLATGKRIKSGKGCGRCGRPTSTRRLAAGRAGKSTTPCCDTDAIEGAGVCVSAEEIATSARGRTRIPAVRSTLHRRLNAERRRPVPGIVRGCDRSSNRGRADLATVFGDCGGLYGKKILGCRRILGA